jgi:uncharacterized protein YraI
MFKNTLKALALAIGLLTPGVAAAAVNAVVTTDLNIRTGPSAKYQRFGTIPGGYRVTVYGCLTGYNWCDVNWAGTRGWVSGKYLAYTGTHAGKRYVQKPVTSIAISIGLPIIGFDPFNYHRRHYADRAWYRDRYLDRRDRYRDRCDVRELRRDVRAERGDVQEAREHLRIAQETGRGIRQARFELREEQRELLDAQERLDRCV